MTVLFGVSFFRTVSYAECSQPLYDRVAVAAVGALLARMTQPPVNLTVVSAAIQKCFDLLLKVWFTHVDHLWLAVAPAANPPTPGVLLLVDWVAVGIVGEIALKLLSSQVVLLKQTETLLGWHTASIRHNVAAERSDEVSRFVAVLGSCDSIEVVESAHGGLLYFSFYLRLPRRRTTDALVAWTAASGSLAC